MQMRKVNFVGRKRFSSTTMYYINGVAVQIVAELFYVVQVHL